MLLMADDVTWERRISAMLEAELKRKGVTYAQLAGKLAAIAVMDSEPNIRNKLSRGRFTAVFLIMPRSYWYTLAPSVFGSIIALCLMMFAYDSGRSSGLYAAGAEYRTRAELKNIQARISQRCVDRIGLARKECAAEAVDAASERQRNGYDLQAQREAARWAWWAVVIAGLQVPIGVFGLFALLRSLNQTDRSLEAARGMINLEQQPFLVVRPVDGGALRWPFRNDKPWRVLFTIENVGRGPAIVKAIYRSWWVCPQYAYPDPIKPKRKVDFWVSKFWTEKSVEIIVGPTSHTESIDSFDWRLWELQPSFEGKSWVSFHGYIRFRDLVGREYETGFLYVFRLDQPERGLHLALPEERAHEYNYHRAVGQLER